MGLPQLDFRVPEATWFKSALAGKFGRMPGLSATGALAWPYKIAVVAVMALVACGTLVTFGSAGAETPSSSEVAALPGTDEASPSVEGQVLSPPSQALLNADDLLATLNLTDYTPEDLAGSLSDDEDDDSDEDSQEQTTAAIKKKLATTNKPTTGTKTPTTSPTTSAPKPSPSPSPTEAPSPTPTPTKAPSPTPTPKPVCKVVDTDPRDLVIKLQKVCT